MPIITADLHGTGHRDLDPCQFRSQSHRSPGKAWRPLWKLTLALRRAVVRSRWAHVRKFVYVDLAGPAGRVC